MLDKLTNIKAFSILVILRILTAIIAMPTTLANGNEYYSRIDNIFRLISTLLMVLLLVIALNTLGKSKNDNDNKQ